MMDNPDWMFDTISNDLSNNKKSSNANDFCEHKHISGHTGELTCTDCGLIIEPVFQMTDYNQHETLSGHSYKAKIPIKRITKRKLIPISPSLRDAYRIFQNIKSEFGLSSRDISRAIYIFENYLKQLKKEKKGISSYCEIVKASIYLVMREQNHPLSRYLIINNEKTRRKGINRHIHVMLPLVKKTKDNRIITSTLYLLNQLDCEQYIKQCLSLIKKIRESPGKRPSIIAGSVVYCVLQKTPEKKTKKEIAKIMNTSEYSIRNIKKIINLGEDNTETKEDFI